MWDVPCKELRREVVRSILVVGALRSFKEFNQGYKLRLKPRQRAKGAQRGPKRAQEDQRGPKRTKEGPRGPKRAKEGQRGPKRAKEGQRGPKRAKERQSLFITNIKEERLTKARGLKMPSTVV